MRQRHLHIAIQRLVLRVVEELPRILILHMRRFETHRKLERLIGQKEIELAVLKNFLGRSE